MEFTRADLRLAITGSRNGDADLGGGLTVSALVEKILSGTAINRQLKKVNTALPFPAGHTFDLQLDAAPPDPTLNLDKLRVFIARADPANTDAIHWTPNIANGWDTTFSGLVILEPGDWLVFVSDVGSVVDGTNKLVEFAPQTEAQNLSLFLVLGFAT